MTVSRRHFRARAALFLVLCAASASAQTVAQRGFVQGTFLGFPQKAPNDPARIIGDFLVREDAFFKPTPWLQFAGGLDFRANSHDEVEDRVRVDFSDRTLTRPRLSVRRLTTTIAHGSLTVDLGKQFIRWGKTDIVTPTDRFAPRDFLHVFNSEFLAVTGARMVVQAGDDAFEGVWVPRLTPSRIPLFDQRWAVVPPDVAPIPIIDTGAALPDGSETGFRWSHTGSGFEYALSFFNGFNHLPNIGADVRPLPQALRLTRIYPPIRTYGVEAAMPTPWFTIKGESVYFTSSSMDTDEYVLYVLQLERQSGEWVLVGGYAGEAVTARRASLVFAPDRGMARSFVGRASYTIGPNRSVAFEGAARQNGDGLYSKIEYSEGRGQHWRATVTGVVVAGHSNDFLGQYHRNSHAGVAVRYSF